MGRVAKYKKVKSFDPYSKKNRGNVDLGQVGVWGLGKLEIRYTGIFITICDRHRHRHRLAHLLSNGSVASYYITYFRGQRKEGKETKPKSRTNDSEKKQNQERIEEN
jgi:hypothetical protein